MFDVDWMGLLTREVLRERTPELIAEACAWAVGMSDQPHYLRTGGRIVATGPTVGERAAKGLPLGDDEDGRLDLGDARPGSFQDALNAVAPTASCRPTASTRSCCTRSSTRPACGPPSGRARTRPDAWAELAEDVGEEEGDLADVVRSGGWEAPLRIDAEHLVLAALGGIPLIEVEAEGLPLSLVRAAEAATRAAVPDPPAAPGRRSRRRPSSPRRPPGRGRPPRADRPGRRRPAGRGTARLGARARRGRAVLPHLPLETATAERSASCCAA